MGALASAAKKVVKWVGNCIEKVISWWSPHKEKVNNITYNYIMVNQYVIINAQDQKTVLEIMGIKKEKDELEGISSANYMNLSYADRERLDQLLDQRDY